MAKCAKDCQREAYRRGLCISHYRRWLRDRDPGIVKRIVGNDEARLLSRIDLTTNPPCWLWTGSINPDGYAHIYFNQGGVGKPRLVHRVAYHLWKGPIGPGLTIDHTCHNQSGCAGGVSCLHRRCINPDHLEAVSQKINNDRSPNSWAARTHCPLGHPYDDANTYVIDGKWRDCRQCVNRRAREYKARQLAVNPKWRRGMKPVATKDGPR